VATSTIFCWWMICHRSIAFDLILLVEMNSREEVKYLGKFLGAPHRRSVARPYLQVSRSKLQFASRHRSFLFFSRSVFPSILQSSFHLLFLVYDDRITWKKQALCRLFLTRNWAFCAGKTSPIKANKSNKPNRPN
jgi:hypothetical protein